MKNFKEIYCKGIFESFENIYIFNTVNKPFSQVMCFNILHYENKDILKKVIDILNNKKVDKYFSKTEIRDDTVIDIDDGDVQLDTRRWGHLTGTLKLSSEDAIKIQDEFIEWICNKLKGIN